MSKGQKVNYKRSRGESENEEDTCSENLCLLQISMCPCYCRIIENRVVDKSATIHCIV